MTMHKLNIVFEAREGAMLRLLGLIQRRGFAVDAIDMPACAGLCKTATLTLSPMGPYRIDVLQRQIERLQEVKSVAIVTAAAKPRRLLRFLKAAPAEITSHI